MNEMKINPGSVFAIIPARGGSKGVPSKNIRSLGGFPLIAYSIAVARMSRNINRIIVSTDSTEIAEVAKKFGAEIPFIRPSEISGDKSTDYEFMNHAINWFSENEKEVPGYWVHLRPTTPFREATRVDEAIDLLCKYNSCDCLRSAHEAPESPFKWFLINDSGYFAGLSGTFSNEELNNPRQSFPSVYVPDGYVDVLKSSYIVENKAIHGAAMKAYISPFCTEVDSIEDFDFLEYQLARVQQPVFKYLEKNYGKR